MRRFVLLKKGISVILPIRVHWLSDLSGTLDSVESIKPFAKAPDSYCNMVQFKKNET